MAGEETVGRDLSPDERSSQDTIRRIDKWLVIVEAQAEKLLGVAETGEGDIYKDKAAELASKYVTLIIRLLDMRMQLDAGQEDWRKEGLKLIFAAQQQQMQLEAPDSI